MQIISTSISVGLATAAVGAILYFYTSNKKAAQVVHDIGLGVTILALVLILFQYFSHL